MASLTQAEETLHLTITLPKNVAEHLHEQVANGQYASESDYVQSMLLSQTLFEPADQNDLKHWMNSEGARRLEALHRDPSTGLTSDQAFEGLTSDETEDKE